MDAVSQQSDLPEQMLTVTEVAKMFNVLPSTVRVWIKEGTLDAVKIGSGHYWRVPRSAAINLSQRKYGDEK